MTWVRRKNIQLCYPYESERLRKWGRGPYIVQPKLDGDRCRALINEYGDVTLLSSEENIINSVPHINEQLRESGLRNIELDGELYVHNAKHQDIHGVVGRTANLHPEFESIEYHIFDIINEKRQAERLLELTHLPTADNIKLVKYFIADDEETIMDTLDACMEDGYEGIVVRHAGAPYIRRRSTYVMKFKPRREDYYTIVGYVEEYSQYGEPKNALGALILDSGIINERNELDTFNVGSGSFLTRARREELWANRSTLVGAIAHVKYQHLTNRKVPRHPVLVDIIKAR